MNEGLCTFITAVVVVVALIMIVIIAVIHYQADQAPPPTQFIASSYGMRCSMNPQGPTQFESDVPQQCAPGLTCVQTLGDLYGICRKSEGTACTTLYECEPSMRICAGVCSLTATGGLNQPPPCGNGLVPVTTAGVTVCKLSAGVSCNLSSDCAEGTCMAGANGLKVCVNPQDYGSPCTLDSQCLDGNCDVTAGVGICQPPGRTTGTLGAYCVYYDNGMGTATSPSRLTACTGTTVCAANITSPSQFGVCAPSVNSWPTPTSGLECSSATGCIPPTVCLGGRCVFPTPAMLCAVGSSGYCLDGYTCVAGTCTPGTGFPGAGNWALIEWVRSNHGQMGKWRFHMNTVAPVPGATLTIHTNSTGINGLYFNGGTLMTLTGTTITPTWVVPSSWLPTDHPTFTLVVVRYVPITGAARILYVYTVTYSGVTTTWFLVTSAAAGTILVPSKGAVTAATSIGTVVDCDYDGRTSNRLIVTLAGGTVNIYTPGTVNTPFIPSGPVGTNTGTSARFYTLIPPSGVTPPSLSGFYLFTNNNEILAAPSSASGYTIKGYNPTYFDVTRQSTTPTGSEIMYIAGSTVHYFYGDTDVVLPTGTASIGPVCFETLDTDVPTVKPRMFCLLTVIT